MTFVAEFSGFQNTAGAPCVVAITSTVPVGHFLALGLSTAAVTGPQLETVADSKGNTWTKAREGQTGSSGGVHLWFCKVATELVSGDTITITPPNTNVAKQPATVQHHDVDIFAMDATGGVVNTPAATSAAPTSTLFTTTQDEELLIGVLNLVSAARTFTPTSPWIAGTKVVTTSGSGDRGVQMVHRYVSAAGNYQAQGTFNSSALYGMIGQGFKLATAPDDRSGRLWFWNPVDSEWQPGGPLELHDGSDWVEYPIYGWEPTANGGLGDWVKSL